MYRKILITWLYFLFTFPQPLWASVELWHNGSIILDTTFCALIFGAYTCQIFHLKNKAQQKSGTPETEIRSLVISPWIWDLLKKRGAGLRNGVKLDWERLINTVIFVNTMTLSSRLIRAHCTAGRRAVGPYLRRKWKWSRYRCRNPPTLPEPSSDKMGGKIGEMGNKTFGTNWRIALVARINCPGRGSLALATPPPPLSPRRPIRGVIFNQLALCTWPPSIQPSVATSLVNFSLGEGYKAPLEVESLDKKSNTYLITDKQSE